jgi:hypothetical protein
MPVEASGAPYGFQSLSLGKVGCKSVGLLNIFRRRRPIRTADELARFLDENASFLVQKGIFEYSRARAGHYAKVLFAEPAFVEVVDRSRWRAYPLGVAMVAEAIDAALRQYGDMDRGQQLAGLSRLALSVFDSHPVPAALGNDAWRALRKDLAQRLQLIGLHPPKRVMDMPEPFAKDYFGLMPIHEKLRGSDFPTIRNYLKVTLCNIHDELTRRMDRAALLGSLRENA